MTSATNITIVIPCHQFDDRGARAIKSAQWAGEVLIIDQNAKIDRQKLGKSVSFRVIEHPQLESFSQMKNLALEEVHTDWVFFLDSDEVISQELRSEIRQHLTDPTCHAMTVKRIDVFLGKPLFHGETRGARFLRIVKRDGARWQGAVHEKLMVSKNASVMHLQQPLIHEPHLSISHFIQKVNFYTSLLSATKERFSLLKLMFFPPGKFLYTFVLRFGFLDGYRGLIYSFVMAIHSSAVRIKRYEHR
jgi:hypothetical protein